jgi:hypothetical protein
MTLEAEDEAFDLNALSVHLSGEASSHLPSVGSGGPSSVEKASPKRVFAGPSSLPNRNDRGANAQDLATIFMVFFAVVSPVRENPIPVYESRGLGDHGLEERGVLKRSMADVQTQNPMALTVPNESDFGPTMTLLELWRVD